MNVKGQAAILAVMLITGVALVSAGFAAFVANSIHHARALTGKVSGKDIAMYGIEYAMQQLLTSPEGADWRPVQDPNLPWDAYEQRRGWDTQYVKYRAPNGYFLLKVSNRPDGYIEIDSIGRPETPKSPKSPESPESPVYYRIIAVVPQPIIQYARFLGGRKPYGQNEHVIGIGQIDFDGDDQPEENSSIVTINGGIFSNGNLKIASQSLMKLLFDSANPNHGLFVAGNSTVSPAKDLKLCDESGKPILPSSPQDSNSQNFEIFPLKGIPRYRDGYYFNKLSLGGINDVYRRLQPILPPTIDAERYRRLIFLGSSGTQVIYIDNKGDIQDNIAGTPSGLKPAQVQFWDWINVPSETDPRRNDLKSGWYYNPNGDPYRRNPPINNTLPDYFRYVPPGCEVELQGASIDDDRDGKVDEDPPDKIDNDGDGIAVDEDGGGVVVIRRHDRPNDVSPISYYQVNSEKVVIFAEGNVRIRGKINASLTVISMGTIYIEGSLETANPTQQHIALLARQNVCLNTTALLPIIVNARRPDTISIASDGSSQQWDNDRVPLHYEYQAVPGPPLPSLTWRIPRFDNPGDKANIVLLHSGHGNEQNYCFIRVSGVSTYHDEPMYYATIDPDNDGKIGEDPDDEKDNDGDDKIDEDPGQPSRCYMSGLSHGIYWFEIPNSFGLTITSGVLDADNDNDKQVDEDPVDDQDNDGDGKVDEDPQEVPYRLSRFKIELLDANGNPIPPWNIRVNAAIYAENGCFFILPPPYFDKTKVGKAAERFRRFNYFDIEINGSIAEYTTAVTMAKSIGLSDDLSDDLSVGVYRNVLDKLAYPKYANGNLTGWQLVRFNYDSSLLQNPPPFLPVSPRPIIIYSGL